MTTFQRIKTSYNHRYQVIITVNLDVNEPSVYTHYLYDAGGNRVKKFTRTSGGNWQSTTYIDGIIEYTEDDSSNLGSISHIMDDSKRMATVRNGYDFGDSTPAIKYNLDDHLGSSNVSVDDTGALVSFEEYYPFGETSFGSYGKKRYRFCGKEKDEESGLFYYGARYYSPWTCRFVSVDPLAGKYAQLTPYNYAGNDPIGDKDIDGMQSEKTDTAQTSKPTPSSPPASNQTAGTNINCHQVQSGETLSGIAKKHGIGVDALRKANNLDPKNDKNLSVGQELDIPAKQASSNTNQSAKQLTPEKQSKLLPQPKQTFQSMVDSKWGMWANRNDDIKVKIPNPITLDDGRKVSVTFDYTSPSDDKNGNQPIRRETLDVLKSALLSNKDINSIDISASTNGNHDDPRHKEGLALDIDKFNKTRVIEMQSSKMIIRFQKALEATGKLHQNFGPEYNFAKGHENHVHFSLNRP